MEYAYLGRNFTEEELRMAIEQTAGCSALFITRQVSKRRAMRQLSHEHETSKN